MALNLVLDFRADKHGLLGVSGVFILFTLSASPGSILVCLIFKCKERGMI